MASKIDRAAGNAGETYQHTEDDMRILTTNVGELISDNRSRLKSGTPGPTLQENFVLRENIFLFDHESIPEPIVHARGSDAKGVRGDRRHFDLNKAALLTKNKKTKLSVRFSTVACATTR